MVSFSFLRSYLCKDQIIFKLNVYSKNLLFIYSLFILTVLTLVAKVVLNAQISKRPPSFKLFTEANERNAEAEKKTKHDWYYYFTEVK